MASFGQVLREAMIAKGLTARQLSNLLGVSESHMSLVIAGKRTLSPALRVRLNEIVGPLAESSEGDKQSFENVRHSPEVRKVTRDIQTDVELTIPLYWQTVPAGNVVPMVSESYDEFNVSKRYANTFAVYIRGDSMKDAGIEDDDIAVFREQSTAVDGQVVYACINGMCTVKVYRSDREGVRLVPANLNYDSIKVTDGDEFVIRGVLLNIIREPKLFRGS